MKFFRFWRFLERFQPRPKGKLEEDMLLWEPWTMRQDIHCYYLSSKNRVELNEEIISVEFDPIDRKMNGSQ